MRFPGHLRRRLESGSGCWCFWAPGRRRCMAEAAGLGCGNKTSTQMIPDDHRWSQMIPDDPRWYQMWLKTWKPCCLFFIHLVFFWEVPTKFFPSTWEVAGQPWCGQASLQPSVKSYQLALSACQQERNAWNTAVGGKMFAENPRSWEWTLRNEGCILQQPRWFLQNLGISPPKLLNDTCSCRSRSSLRVFRLFTSWSSWILFLGETVGLGWPVVSEVGFIGEGS